MKEQFVPYEIALELKKLGFDEECLAYYNLDKEMFMVYNKYKKNDTFKNSQYDHNIMLATPLYQQAFDWFRKNYLLHSSVDFDMIKETDEDDIELYDYKINEQWSVGKEYYFDYSYGFKHIDHKCHFRTYEDARIECLKKLIEVVKNK